MQTERQPIQEITVSLGERTYPILIGRSILEQLPKLIAMTGSKGAAALVTDVNVSSLYADQVKELIIQSGLQPVVCAMPAGEEHKRLERVEEFCGQFLQAGLDRSSLVIALGGGVVGDTAGFAAASYMRGIPFIQIPTTIVAQVDSSVGGKTAVNHAMAKNVIGAFHQPAAVLIDLDFLSTLPEREIQAGLAEVIKHGVIADPELFAYMEAHSNEILNRNLDTLLYPVRRSCEIKSEIVAADEREQGLRANLNYGHTFGHAIEAVTGYTEFLHGEAIALGMHAAATLSLELGLTDDAFRERQRACLTAYGLPTHWPDLPVEDTLEAMKKDKKVRTGTMKFIVADAIGSVVQRTDVTPAQAAIALESLKTKD